MKVNPNDEKSLLEPGMMASDKMGEANGSIEMVQMGRPNQTMARRNKQVDIKRKLIGYLEGSLVTITMSIVTLFALIGDDIRVWQTTKSADPIFLCFLSLSMFLFGTEIILTSVVIDDFKYSFFFWLDIIATFSLVPDIDFLRDSLKLIVLGTPPRKYEVDVLPGEITVQSLQQDKIAQVFKSLRLIRLIRIIKLYKYAMKALSDKEQDDLSKSKKKKKKKQVEVVVKDVEPEESEFKKETDPSKLGGALVDSINRKTIIGVLLMLMVLPLFSASEIDYSGEYALREAFWFGRSSCTDPAGFYCNQDPWITKEGWRELLRGLTRSA